MVLKNTKLEEHTMSNMQAVAIRYIQQLPGNKLSSAVDYLRYLCEQELPSKDILEEVFL